MLLYGAMLEVVCNLLYVCLFLFVRYESGACVYFQTQLKSLLLYVYTSVLDSVYCEPIMTVNLFKSAHDVMLEVKGFHDIVFIINAVLHQKLIWIAANPHTSVIFYILSVYSITGND